MRAQRAYARQFDLIRGGVQLQEGSGMGYSFTRLNDVKPAMIAESIQDARRGAERFAQDSGASVGGSARPPRAISRSARATATRTPRKAAAAAIRRCRRCGW